MANPFFKANPLLSMWLSAANAWGGAVHGLWTAEFHRQQSAMISEAMKQMTRFWTGAAWLPAGAAAATANAALRPVAAPAAALAKAAPAVIEHAATAVEEAARPKQPATAGGKGASATPAAQQLRSPSGRRAAAAKTQPAAKASVKPRKATTRTIRH